MIDFDIILRQNFTGTFTFFRQTIGHLIEFGLHRVQTHLGIVNEDDTERKIWIQRMGTQILRINDKNGRNLPLT